MLCERENDFKEAAKRKGINNLSPKKSYEIDNKRLATLSALYTIYCPNSKNLYTDELNKFDYTHIEQIEQPQYNYNNITDDTNYYYIDERGVKHYFDNSIAMGGKLKKYVLT